MLGFLGRGGRIRTDDFCLPKAALYRAELRPESPPVALDRRARNIRCPLTPPQHGLFAFLAALSFAMDTSNPPGPQQYAADLRLLQIIWSALVTGVALMTAVMGGLTVSGSVPTVADNAAIYFYLTAGFSIVALMVAFSVQRRMLDGLPMKGTHEEIVSAVRTAGIISLAVLEASAFVACISTLLTGELINLLFVVPFFGFALLFFPTASRFESLLNMARRG